MHMLREEALLIRCYSCMNQASVVTSRKYEYFFFLPSALFQAHCAVSSCFSYTVKMCENLKHNPPHENFCAVKWAPSLHLLPCPVRRAFIGLVCPWEHRIFFLTTIKPTKFPRCHMLCLFLSTLLVEATPIVLLMQPIVLNYPKLIYNMHLSKSH